MADLKMKRFSVIKTMYMYSCTYRFANLCLFRIWQQRFSFQSVDTYNETKKNARKIDEKLLF